MARGKILELPKTLDAGIDRAFERAHRDLECIAGVDHQRVGCRDQRVPVGGVDIDADLPRRIGGRVAEGDDLLLQPDFQPRKRHGGGRTRISARDCRAGRRTGRRAAIPRPARRWIAGSPASVPLMPSCASSTLPFSPRPAQIARSGSRSSRKSGKRGELVEGGDLERHGERLSGGQGRGNPAKSAGILMRLPGCLAAAQSLAYQPLPCPG